MLGRTRRIHFVGIGGIGMSGIAELLANLGYEVSGSDAKRSTVTDRLERLGVRVSVGHDAAHVGRADVVVVSSAIKAGNPETIEAVRRQIPVIPRAEMLAELMRLRYGIAIAGAHGKTSTTSMVALVLERAGLDPTAVIGGRLSAFGSNARLGRGDYMVVEADESDRSFLKLSPAIAVITNIDHEHMESYGSWADLQQAFVEFANKVPFYGAVIACADDEPVRNVLPRITRRLITYGLATADGRASASVTAHGMTLEAFGSRATVRYWTPEGPEGAFEQGAADDVELGELRLQVPGRHNLLNALAAVAVGLEVGIPFDTIAASLAEFQGAERRFQRLGEEDGVMVVDDYGHHPTEIAAVHRRGARGDRPARGCGVPAAPLLADAPAAARVRLGAERRRRGGADRHLRRRRAADSGRDARRAGLGRARGGPGRRARRARPRGSPGGRREDGTAGRSGHHARRRIDWRHRRAHPRGDSSSADAARRHWGHAGEGQGSRGEELPTRSHACPAGASPEAARALQLARRPGAARRRVHRVRRLSGREPGLPLEPVPRQPGSRARERADLERRGPGDRRRSPGRPHPDREPGEVAHRAARVTLARRGRAAPRAAVDHRRLRIGAAAVRALSPGRSAVPRCP